MTVFKSNGNREENDKDIIFWNKLRNGDKNGLESLYLKYAQELFRYGMAISKNKDLVKDAIQDLFIDFWKYRENLNSTDNVKRYICKSLTNRIIKISSKENSRCLPDIYELKNSIYEENEPSLLLDFDQEDETLNSKLYQALDNLPKRQKKVIQLTYFDKLGGDKIAQTMEINLQSVYNLTSKALVNLRKGLVSIFLIMLL